MPEKRALAALGCPLYLKLDGVHSCRGQGGAIIRCADAAAALAQLSDLRKDYRKVLIQGHVEEPASVSSWRAGANKH